MSDQLVNQSDQNSDWNKFLANKQRPLIDINKLIAESVNDVRNHFKIYEQYADEVGYATEQIEKNPKLRNKKVDVLVKPVKLEQIEHSILNLVKK